MPDASETVSNECQRCGANVRSDDAFCRQCGGRLDPEVARRAWGSALSWAFYLVLMLGTALGVYLLLESRAPGPPEHSRNPTSVGHANERADAGSTGRDMAKIPSQTPKVSKASPEGGSSPTRPVRAARSSRGKAPRDASVVAPAKIIPRGRADAGSSARSKADGGLSPREAARARVNAGAIGYVVNHHRVRLRRCLERLTKKGLEPSGLVEIHLSVGAEGRALRSKVHRNTTGYASLGRCIANEMASWRYPHPAGGRAELIYPFRFSSGK